ncbi:iron uptake transporter deferrochelatase/peroxidase subunit [Micropruina sonneratiae]|uniref:iron uptake transporter deferrochelatase/peroxidase subunit n=1 Tax=Micropruina sonneratiae TaxID=2986940 RepID=UPI002225BEAC|nr:iron uptake transporter deferrochelatase/peroxidase subunit [Micropruina sp. KQZ13P-5]MCW3158526.1 iron uptake transporter deferrochelatase/peroxidase subunit [Micropruina sp. KQZ13P-5]
MTQNRTPPPAASGPSRRRLLAGGAAAAAAGATVGAGVTAGLLTGATQPATTPTSASTSATDEVDLTRIVPFYDQTHQAGIRTPPQRHSVFMTFNLNAGTDAQDLQVLLARWSAAIAQLTQGKTIGTVEPSRPDAVGTDTGEAYGLAPASLTVTVGLGPGVFDDRYGLAAKRPALLADLPRIPGDVLQAGLTGGDLSLQACADDPQVAYHAVRNLARMVTTTAHTHWVVLGFGRASAGPGQETPRNLMGFKDGTRNVAGDDDYDRFVWLGEDAGWMAGGTYQVVRKITMTIETWDFDRISDQQRIFGRTKDEGAPLTGTAEFDTPDFAARGDGGYVIDQASHIALAAPENNAGVKILRRGYNFTDGLNDQGLLDAGLLFISYQNDPQHFIDLQNRLGRFDLLNEYIRHVGSGIFAIPPGPPTGSYIGQALFA